MVILILIVLGLCLGSFVNALVWRVHQQSKAKTKKAKAELSIAHGRSMCSNCHHELAPSDLIPVISWVMLRGKCRYCHKPITDNPLAELITPLLFVVSYFFWPYPWNTLGKVEFIFWLVFLVGFVALALYDLRWYLLPNKILYPLFCLAALLIVTKLLMGEDKLNILLSAFWGVVIGGGIFWAIFQVSNGKWIGGGDVKLGWLLGVVVGGPANSFLLIFVASLLGCLVGIPLQVSKKLPKNRHIPFGPFLLLATVIVQLFGGSLVGWYKAQLGL